MNTDQYISLKEISNKIKLSEISLRRYIKVGRLTAIKIGREYKVLQGDADRFIESFGNNEKPIDSNKINKTHLTHTPIKHLKTIHGVNSHISETLLELAQHNQSLSIEEIKDIIKTHANECLDLITNIENNGVSDTNIALNLYLIDEAIRNLKIKRRLIESIIYGKTLLLLPLPPHLSDTLLTIISSKRVLISGQVLPPHLRSVTFQKLTNINYFRFGVELQNIEAVVLEAYIEDGIIFVRDDIFDLIHSPYMRALRVIYLHSIPHIPPQSKFIELFYKAEKLTIDLVKI